MSQSGAREAQDAAGQDGHGSAAAQHDVDSDVARTEESGSIEAPGTVTSVDVAPSKAPEVHVSQQTLDIVTGREPEAVLAKEAEEKADLNHAVHLVLVVGLVCSVVLMLAGVALALFRGQELPEVVPSPVQAFSRALALRPSGFLALGLVVLVATPIVRVIGSCLVFLYERDWRYALITAIVLAITLISIRTGAG